MEEWDSMDWDEKVSDIIKSHEQQEHHKVTAESSVAAFEIPNEDEGNYFEANEQKKKLKEQNKSHRSGAQNSSKARSDTFTQSYSIKDLVRIRNYVSAGSFHNLIHETFGQLERFIATHKDDPTAEMIVELLIIDVALLDIPFHAHNQLLLAEISKLNCFWSQLIRFLKEFLGHTHKDVKFLLTVDMNGFFDNIECLLHNLLVNNHFNAVMEHVLNDILMELENHAGNKWSQLERLRKLQIEYERNLSVFKVYDIYPTVQDLCSFNENLHPNLIQGEYENVAHYLQIQLPLLKEDFTSKLREGVKHLKALQSVEEIVKTPDAWIHSKVQIKAVTKPMWNMSCRIIVVQVESDQSINWKRRFFNGQMLCFSSTKEFNDLVVAVVMSRDATEQPGDVVIEIIQTENINEIYNQDLIMLEPKTFFEPYHRVFNVMKSLNELNFPFKEQILKVHKNEAFPSYQHPSHYFHKEFTFNVDNLSEWPSSQQISLEKMQLKAVQSAVTSEFTIIQGPPGCGKTFVGLEILKIFLENTNETILVLTQTNNALDKFLIGASKFTENIARMGGQSKSDELDKFLVKSSTPLESKNYMKMLQFKHRDEVASLMKSNDNHDEIHRKISTHHRLIEEIHQLSLFHSINQKRVIGMTTTFAARNSSINKMLKPGIVLIEEASEVLESHVLVSLTKATNQIIMIGDHQQLRPLTSSYELSRNFHFNVSLFERLIRNDFNFVALDVQMRMRPDICDLVRGTIYKSLKDGASVSSYPSVKGMPRNFFCVSHSQPENVGEGETSKENIYEAEYIVKLCNFLVLMGNDPRQITILTVYAAQAARIKRSSDYRNNVNVAVLDAFQGEESDIILLSLVRSNNRRDIGFLATENRIAVVLSRAKFGFYIVANMSCLASASKTWKEIMQILTEKEAIGDRIPGVEINL